MSYWSDNTTKSCKAQAHESTAVTHECTVCNDRKSTMFLLASACRQHTGPQFEHLHNKVYVNSKERRRHEPGTCSSTSYHSIAQTAQKSTAHKTRKPLRLQQEADPCKEWRTLAAGSSHTMQLHATPVSVSQHQSPQVLKHH
jgi:hypothetical protein